MPSSAASTRTRRPVHVLLVSCYELGHQPLHVASPAAFLREAGHHVEAVDLATQPPAALDAAVDAAELVAVGVPMHTAMRLATAVVERVRARRGVDVTVVIYGLYAALCRDAIPPGMVDHWVGGEFEEELVRIASGAPSGRSVVLDRLRFPIPARDLLPPLERYTRLLIEGEARLTGYVEASRGCVHRCRHCPIPAVYEGRIRVVPREVVLADVARLCAMGARHITFGDPDFLNAVPHSLATVRAIHDRYPELTFDITTKIEHIHEHAGVFDELRGCGLVFVVSAVESLDDSVLRILDKGHTAADAVEAVRRLRDGGIELRPSFLPFTPWGGLRSYLDLLDMVVEEDLVGSVDPVQLSIRLLLPVGSLLLAHPQMRPHLDGYNAAALTWRWRHPDPAMDRLQRRVAALVAADADAVVEPRTTHHRIRHQAAAAAAAAGITWTAAGPALAPAGPSRPRLSEAWFC